MSSPARLVFTLAFAFVAEGGIAPARAQAPYAYDEAGDKRFMTNTNVLERFAPTGDNNRSHKITGTRARAEAAFTAEPIRVDGVREAAWDTARPYPIASRFDSEMLGAAPSATAEGALRLLWDGPVLYLLVEVSGDTTPSGQATPVWNQASYGPDTDGLFAFMDVFNDQWGLETDTQGVFFLGANPELTEVTSFNNPAIPSLGSFFNPENQDYSTRLKAFESSGYRAGAASNYVYEIALQIEGFGDAWDRELTKDTEAERLDTDPYLLPVANGRSQSPYDYYWGGFNTITGGRDGIDGSDGWYFYRF